MLGEMHASNVGSKTTRFKFRAMVSGCNVLLISLGKCQVTLFSSYIMLISCSCLLQGVHPALGIVLLCYCAVAPDTAINSPNVLEFQVRNLPRRVFMNGLKWYFLRIFASGIM